MNEFLTLFKYEFKKQFPPVFKKRKIDIVGFVLSIIFTITIATLCILLMSTIAQNYVLVKIDKVLNVSQRAHELLNLFYCLIMLAMFFVCIEKMRKSILDQSDRKVFLRLPIKQSNLFLAKILVLMIVNYLTALLLVLPVNIIIFVALKPGITFWLSTLFVWLVMPLIVTMFASVFVVPYTKLIEFLKNKYALIFIILTILLVAVFFVYTIILGIFQKYLETGFIKFLFNEQFISALNSLLVWTYPTNCLAGIVVGRSLLKSFLVVFGFVIVSCLVIYFITQKMYYGALYRNEQSKTIYKKPTKTKKSTVLITLLKKEFVSVFREPKHLFSYFVIAAAMPVMCYCCFTLFDALIQNMLGMKLNFELALLIVLVFSVLTNTFCATNITREGVSLLKQKTLPISANKILGAKVLFCSIVSTASIILSGTVLIAVTSLETLSGLLCIFIGVVFSFAQILIATRVDLNGLKVLQTSVENEKRTTKTIAKVVGLGLIVAVIVGLGSVLLSVLSKGILDIKINVCFVYIIPVLVSVVYCLFAYLFYRKNLQKSFDKAMM